MKPPPPAPEKDPAIRALNFNVRFNQWLNRVLAKLKVDDVPHIKRIIITVVGGTVLILGAAMVFLPGPGLLVILGGMAILGTEYAWARRWLRKGKLMARKALSQTQRIFSAKEMPADPPAPAPTAPKPRKPGKTLDDGKTTLAH